MVTLTKKEIRITKKQRGATMVEYAIMIALIAIVSIAVISSMGKNVNNTFSTVNSYIGDANSG